MTNEQSLKEGDRVMLADDANAIGVVRFAGKESCIVDFGLGDSTTDYKDIVPLDRRTDFLRRLGALLREFDARIGYFIGDDEKYGWSDYPFLKVGEEAIKYPAGEIDEIHADNIMDFDKE